MYERLGKEVGWVVVESCPNVKLLDAVPPLMAVYESGVVSMLVPEHYLTNLPGYGRKSISSMVDEGKILIILRLPIGAAAQQGAWRYMIPDPAQQKLLVKQHLRSQEVLSFDDSA